MPENQRHDAEHDTPPEAGLAMQEHRSAARFLRGIDAVVCGGFQKGANHRFWWQPTVAVIEREIPMAKPDALHDRWFVTSADFCESSLHSVIQSYHAGYFLVYFEKGNEISRLRFRDNMRRSASTQRIDVQYLSA